VEGERGGAKDEDKLEELADPLQADSDPETAF
jgi:hypothetical protein